MHPANLPYSRRLSKLFIIIDLSDPPFPSSQLTFIGHDVFLRHQNIELAPAEAPIPVDVTLLDEGVQAQKPKHIRE
jgi:hypothetical protein